jgi:hypothetical protein
LLLLEHAHRPEIVLRVATRSLRSKTAPVARPALSRTRPDATIPVQILEKLTRNGNMRVTPTPIGAMQYVPFWCHAIRPVADGMREHFRAILTVTESRPGAPGKRGFFARKSIRNRASGKSSEDYGAIYIESNFCPFFI